VLVGKKRRGHDHRGLVAVLHGLERRPERHLGLAESHVAAHQPVHGPLLLHVGEDILDGPLLVRRLLEGERRLELPVEVVRRGKGRAAHGLPRGVYLHQVLRHREDVLLHPLLGPRPGGRAEAIDLGGRDLGA